MLQETSLLPDYLTLTNVAAAQFGARIIYCTDEHFATADHLLKEGRGGCQGEQIDGWLSRRKRTEGHDYCIIELGAMSSLRGLELDTHEFIGNYPPYASVQACCLPLGTSLEEILVQEDWDHLVKKVALRPNERHFIDMYSDYHYTHIKLHLYPDGGLARFKAYGNLNIDWSYYEEETQVNLAAANLGACVVACSDEFFGAAVQLLGPEPAKNSSDAWITQRNRLEREGDWVVVQLAQVGKLSGVTIDTQPLIGNCPAKFSLEGLYLPEQDSNLANGETFDVQQVEHYHWKSLVNQQVLPENTCVQQVFAELTEPFTHVRLRIYPDGGVARLRLFGQPMV
ncbi:MAG: allantoicase [Aureispira sp.]